MANPESNQSNRSAVANQIQSAVIKEDMEEGSALDTSDQDLVKQRQIELEEERKLKAKHPCIQRPVSEFLQKRLHKGQKYFDSGDYNMAKASTDPKVNLPDATIPMPTIDSKILNKHR